MDWTRILSWTLTLILLGVILGWFFRRSEAPWALVCRWMITLISALGIWALFHRFFKPSAGLNIAAGFALGIGAAVFGLIMAITWTRSVISSLTSPLTSLFYNEKETAEPTPLYSVAQAHRKKGNYREAVVAVQEQLARFPDDLTGTLLLAEIQAVDLKDLAAAEQTLEYFIQRTDAPNAAVALSQIADWELGLKEDLPGARMALERIRMLCPGTEAASVAEQRLAHLADANAVEAVQHPKRFEYVEFPRPARVGEVLDVRPKPVEPGQEASQLVQHLEKFPEDFQARERLAFLYADHFHRMDLARMQMAELLATKRVSHKQTVAWLNRLADLELRGAHDMDAARAALQRIIDLDPKAAAADQAQRRMNLLARELRRYTA